MINIRGIEENTDPFYRYRMPKLIITRQKTFSIIVNFPQICASLNREPEHLLCYLKNKLANPMKIDKLGFIKISNMFDYDDIQNAIFEYIQYFVLCPLCTNPETIIINNNMKCNACSHYDVIKITNKVVGKVLSTYIK